MTNLRSTSLSSAMRLDPKDDRDFKFSSIADNDGISKKSSVIPTKVSWRDEMSPVKYQGNLGSCVAFSVCALKEWQEKKEHQEEVLSGKKDIRGNEDYNLSESWVYWNAKKIDPWPNEEGTNFRSALKVVQKIGVPLEKSWPYSDNPLNIGEPKRWAHLIARWACIGSYWSVGTRMDDIKRAICDGPILFGMTCHREMYGNLNSGRIPYPLKPKEILGYHAVLAVGYDDEKREICFKNSWSPFWGDAGYGYLSYRYVENFCSDHWAVKDIAVTPEMLKGVVSLIK